MLLAGATRYDRGNAAIDLAGESRTADVLFEATPEGWTRDGETSSLDRISEELRSGGGDLLHFHGASPPHRALLSGLEKPWVTDRRVDLPRRLFRRIPPPAAILTERSIPEAVADHWFARGRSPRRRDGRSRVGSYARSDSARNNAEQAAGRIQRFRDDVDWVLYEIPPTPEEMSGLDLWVDPTSDEEDLDGMVGEAIACLTPVIAARTETNARRLDAGKAGLLPPVGDHNEMTHAVLNMLFKNEVSIPLRQHAESIRDRFRPRHRREAVGRVYVEVVR